MEITISVTLDDDDIFHYKESLNLFVKEHPELIGQILTKARIQKGKASK